MTCHGPTTGVNTKIDGLRKRLNRGETVTQRLRDRQIRKDRAGNAVNKISNYCTSILRPSTTAPFIASRADSAFTLLANVTKPKPCMHWSRQTWQTDRQTHVHAACTATSCNIEQSVIKQHAGITTVAMTAMSTSHALHATNTHYIGNVVRNIKFNMP